jgi:hypothetical protein
MVGRRRHKASLRAGPAQPAGRAPSEGGIAASGHRAGAASGGGGATEQCHGERRPCNRAASWRARAAQHGVRALGGAAARWVWSHSCELCWATRTLSSEQRGKQRGEACCHGEQETSVETEHQTDEAETEIAFFLQPIGSILCANRNFLKSMKPNRIVGSNRLPSLSHRRLLLLHLCA